MGHLVNWYQVGVGTSGGMSFCPWGKVRATFSGDGICTEAWLQTGDQGAQVLLYNFAYHCQREWYIVNVLGKPRPKTERNIPSKKKGDWNLVSKAYVALLVFSGSKQLL